MVSKASDKDNVGSEVDKEKARPWTKREMEEAEPLPLPTVDDDEDKAPKRQ